MTNQVILGPESHPPLSAEELPMNLREAFKAHLGDKQLVSRAIVLAALDTVEDFIPIADHEGKTSDPLTAIQTGKGNCRARIKTARALLLPYTQYRHGVVVEKLASASHVSGVVVDPSLHMVVFFDPSLRSVDKHISIKLPVINEQASKLLYEEPDQVTVTYAKSVEIDGAEIIRIVDYRSYTEQQVLEGTHHVAGFDVSRLVVFGGLAEMALGQKGFTTRLLTPPGA
ncbi:hypothetical protein KC992_03615 [Candidatus Saccharibacteria bacterium]|nr:hypothetical protein [Candidatus Saccharibacteria bacterium]MCA9328937.1 hypothetical protein [Candidatus Saccharibacteria bacterium]